MSGFGVSGVPFHRATHGATAAIGSTTLSALENLETLECAMDRQLFISRSTQPSSCLPVRGIFLGGL